jgi:hypothetical protein
MSQRDHIITDEHEYSPLFSQGDESEDNFWENYQHLQQSVSMIDRVDISVVDTQTGKKTNFNQVRFSLRNLIHKH